MPLLREILKKEAKFRLDIRKNILAEMSKKILRKELPRIVGKCPSLKTFRTRKDNYVCTSRLIQVFYPKARQEILFF